MKAKLLPGERAIRRRGSIEQGQALEILGHAVEYLVDSRMFVPGSAPMQREHEAIQLLMRSSRAVFLECPEVVPMRHRVGRWLAVGVGRRARQGA